MSLSLATQPFLFRVEWFEWNLHPGEESARAGEAGATSHKTPSCSHKINHYREINLFSKSTSCMCCWLECGWCIVITLFYKQPKMVANKTTNNHAKVKSKVQSQTGLKRILSLAITVWPFTAGCPIIISLSLSPPDYYYRSNSQLHFFEDSKLHYDNCRLAFEGSNGGRG